jgi:murein DD-endopeptidase MepM/ murein hydrolase activator NlpD
MRTRQHLVRVVAGTAVAVVTGIGAVIGTAGPVAADHDRLPAGRTPTPYVVQPGDTATGLAVRFHAWTAELVAHNHLGPDGALRVGQRLVIPVVSSRSGSGGANGSQADDSSDGRSWQHPDPSRETVRRVIARTARRHGVDPQLALAVSWQEAGWQMHHVSSANAIGAMQVLPSTARWMEQYAGHRLRLRRLPDNAEAGVRLLDVLGRHTTRRAHRIGAYYQGLGAVREHGLFGETRTYVANVVAIKRRLEAGRPPA